MSKCFTTIVGQSDWSRNCYWLSCLAYGQSRRHRGIWWAKAPPNSAPIFLQIEIWKL